MKVILRDKGIWLQTNNASAKLITFPTHRMGFHAIRWCGTFKDSEDAGVALINYCNEKGLKPGHSPISKSFGRLSGMRANFHWGVNTY